MTAFITSLRPTQGLRCELIGRSIEMSGVGSFHPRDARLAGPDDPGDLGLIQVPIQAKRSEVLCQGELTTIAAHVGSLTR